MGNENNYLDFDRRLGIIFQYVLLVSMALYYSYRFREMQGDIINVGIAVLSAIVLILINVLINHIFLRKLIGHKSLIIHEVILVLTL